MLGSLIKAVVFLTLCTAEKTSRALKETDCCSALSYSALRVRSIVWQSHFYWVCVVCFCVSCRCVPAECVIISCGWWDTGRGRRGGCNLSTHSSNFLLFLFFVSFLSLPFFSSAPTKVLWAVPLCHVNL